MNPILGAVLAVLAIAVGYIGYGWPGVLLGLTVVVFWMLLQFSRVVRAMRQAGERPVGIVDNAVMLNAKLNTGMRLIDILPLTKSLGTKLSDAPETFAWLDEGGDSVEIELDGGRLSTWRLKRRERHDSPEVPTAQT
jgi:hypothetical protein